MNSTASAYPFTNLRQREFWIWSKLRRDDGIHGLRSLPKGFLTILRNIDFSAFQRPNIAFFLQRTMCDMCNQIWWKYGFWGIFPWRIERDGWNCWAVMPKMRSCKCFSVFQSINPLNESIALCKCDFRKIREISLRKTSSTLKVSRALFIRLFLKNSPCFQ